MGKSPGGLTIREDEFALFLDCLFHLANPEDKRFDPKNLQRRCKEVLDRWQNERSMRTPNPYGP